MTLNPPYTPKRPLMWLSSNAEARRYDCLSMWNGYIGGQYVGTVMEFDHASYASIFGERLGACFDVPNAKARINRKFDEMSAHPEVVVIEEMQVNDREWREILRGAH